jgi:hypothetical protein
MCDETPPPGIGRRRAIVGAAALLGAGIVARRAAADDVPADAPLPVAVAPGLEVRLRDTWGADLPPRGRIAPEDARFLLVHHTASASNYASARDVIRGTYSFHTGAAKGWPDVCYEFFIGRDGDVWEGRAGAVAGPVVADATGGSQGFAQLVCLLGDFTAAPPTPAALDALVSVLAWLSRRDGIDVAPGASTTFVSRGSDRWRSGTVVTTPTIAGHRDMTYTSCPGNTLYPLLPALREQVHARRTAWDDAARAQPSPEGLMPARRLGVVSDPAHP